MTKKMGAKKGIIITITTILLVLSVLFAVSYYNDTKEIRVMEPVEHMEQREGVSMDNILLEIMYSVKMDEENMEPYVDHYLYVFENGDVYSGYMSYCQWHHTEEQLGKEEFFYSGDDRYWSFLNETCYWGRLSPRDLDSVMNELVQAVPYREHWEDMPQPTVGIQKGMRTREQTGIQMENQVESQADRAFWQEDDVIYDGHRYRGRLEYEGTESWETISSTAVFYANLNDEHAHNAIDIIKSTWAYGQWTNQIFGEGWEERIDLKDVW